MIRSSCHLKILCCLLILVQGELKIDYGACRGLEFDCDCGVGSGRTVPVYKMLCNFVYNWQDRCPECENMVEVYKDGICRNYRLCGECQEGLEACRSCPVGFYGRWCDQKCECLNGATCIGPNSLCHCPPEYQGRFCEIRIGCDVPVIDDSMIVTKFPELSPTVLHFRCPEKGFMLKGSPRLTCNMATRTWSGTVPVCVPVCSVPDQLNNVLLVDLHDNDLVLSGDTLRFRCQKGFTLMGDSESRCLNGSSWSHPFPSCAKLTFCKKPRLEHYTTYQVLGPKSYPPFSNGTQIAFQCTEGRLLLGESTLKCGENGRWSEKMPSCIKVHSSEVDCNTRAYELLSNLGHMVRLHCPGGCSSGETEVWGNGVYDDSSSVCRAALHAGRISNDLGGSVLVVKTGSQDYFEGTWANNVQSKRKNAEGGSFKFQDNKHLGLGGAFRECPKGWWRTANHCFITMDQFYSWTEAKWICHNLESALPAAKASDVLSHIVDQAILENSLKRFWLMDQSNAIEDAIPDSEEMLRLLDSNSNGTESNENQESVPNCLTIQVLQPIATAESFSCGEKFPFVCVIQLEDQQKTCADLGRLESGLVELEGAGADRLYVGSVLRYKCNPLYVLKGNETTTCTESGQWSSDKPRCVKAPTCSDPLVPPYGSLEIKASSQTSNSGRTAFGRRSNLFGVLSRPKQRRSVQSSRMSLPPGHHHVGTRVFYSCRSRYYELIGSQTRRCQADGTWSGRQVSCLPLCGRSDSPRSPFIVNGNASEVGQWPWQVGIGYLFQGMDVPQMLCGGSLVSELWVLTAAHCVTEDSSIFPVDMSSLTVYAGKYYQDMERDDDFVQRRKVVEVHVHPDYDPSVFDSDIALIKLDSPLELTTRVQPVCLPNDRTTKVNLVEGRKGVVTGWGLTEEGVNSDSLRQAVIKVISDEACEQGYQEAGLPLTVSENMFCGGNDKAGADACSGDSGGPLVFQVDKGERKHWVLEGVVSWGSLKGCGLPNQYSGFTTVNRFLDWIHHFI